MAYASRCTRFVLSLLLAVLLASFAAPAASAGAPELPTLEEFIETVADGDEDSLTGIYVPDVMASRIVPQPDRERLFVSSMENTLTEFGLAEQFGSTGLLAHNTQAGRYFAKLEVGQVFTLIYGDGRTESFLVTEMLRFRALEPEDTRGMFLDLRRGDLLRTDQVFRRVYARPGNVILQTCIASGDVLSWGRLFVIAEPYEGKPEAG
jgi:hypothetical protein